MLEIVIPPKTRVNEKKISHVRMNFERGIHEGAINAGQAIVKRAAILLSTGIRTGRKYKNLPNRSSAPGEFPRSQSGRLAKSLYSNASGSLSFRVGATEKWAIFLAAGTKIMSARPNKTESWLIFVINQNEGITRNYLDDGVFRRIR